MAVAGFCIKIDIVSLSAASSSGNVLLGFISKSGLVPPNTNRLVIARELFTIEPELEPKISRRDNDSNVKLADVVLDAPGKQSAAFPF